MIRRQSLPIHQPCGANWEQMEGGGAVRRCQVCDQDVRDLSAMPEAEARRFLAAGGEPCIRYSHDAEGRLLFADRPATSRPRLAAAAAALTLVSLAASGCLMGKRSCPTDAPQTEAAPGEPAAALADAERPPAPAGPAAAASERPPA